LHKGRSNTKNRCSEKRCGGVTGRRHTWHNTGTRRKHENLSWQKEDIGRTAGFFG